MVFCIQKFHHKTSTESCIILGGDKTAIYLLFLIRHLRRRRIFHRFCGSKCFRRRRLSTDLMFQFSEIINRFDNFTALFYNEAEHISIASVDLY